MPASPQISPRSSDPLSDAIVRAWEAFQQQYLDTAAKAGLKQEGGFISTLKQLKKPRMTDAQMQDVTGGVVEIWPSGRVDAALETEGGRLVIGCGQRMEHGLIASAESLISGEHLLAPELAKSEPIGPDQLLARFADLGASAPVSLICEIELTRFDPGQRKSLLPLLWRYILNHRDSNVPDQLAAVGAAIRKYLAIAPMDEMNQIAVLLEPGHRSMSLASVIEVAKMIYRNFEVHPPIECDPHPELAERLWEVAEACANSRVLRVDKCSAAASLAIQAIVAMRSKLADRAWRKAATCPHGWFTDLVRDGLDRLYERWREKDNDAAAWLAALLKGAEISV